MIKRLFPLVLCWCLATVTPSWAQDETASSHAAAGASSECIIPAKRGGGFELTCKLTQRSLEPQSRGSMRLHYLPGGGGAIAWHALLAQRPAEPNTLVAFSSGSLLNLALGKFGPTTTHQVRWVAGFGLDYGVIAVRADSPYHSLPELLTALKRDPTRLPIGVGGSAGSHDWLKATLVAGKAGIAPERLRFVTLEGGGETFTALLNGYVPVISGDASVAQRHLGKRKLRLLAVLAEHRLPGKLAQVPTAREQGVDVVWPMMRGVYMGGQVADADYQRWVSHFQRMLASGAFDQLRTEQGLWPLALTGHALTAYVEQSVTTYRQQLQALGLVPPGPSEEQGGTP